MDCAVWLNLLDPDVPPTVVLEALGDVDAKIIGTLKHLPAIDALGRDR
jgi:hypothetical protein